jgi:DHA1 family bicyclomycin/chloramphenicol resistance-like MFS transporter
VAYALAVGFTTASFFVFIAGAPYVVVESMGRKPEVYGVFFLINASGYMAGNFVSGRFGERLGPERLILFGIGFSVVSMLLSLVALGLGPWDPATFFLPLVINSFGNGLAIPGGMALALSVRPDLAGTAAGITGRTAARARRARHRAGRLHGAAVADLGRLGDARLRRVGGLALFAARAREAD